MPGPWRHCLTNRVTEGGWQILISHMMSISMSDEMPGPWRLSLYVMPLASHGKFQSQTRCQAPGDVPMWFIMMNREGNFNLRRDARPLATRLRQATYRGYQEISIS